VLLSPGASSPKITGVSPYVFRNWPSDALQGQLGARHAVAKMGAKRVAILYINNEYGAGLRGVFGDELTKLGGTAVAAEPFDQGASDFRGALTKLKGVPADLLYVLAYPKEWPLILVQAKELGLKFPILGTETTEDPAIVANAREAADGVVYSVPKRPDATNDRVRTFLSAYRAKYGAEPGITADAGYDAVYLLADAIRAVGNDGPAIRGHLLTVKDYQGAAGKTAFDANGDCLKEFEFRRIVNGKPVNVD
jgi:branched-chain amino acid transport system substrate-binding protein